VRRISTKLFICRLHLRAAVAVALTSVTLGCGDHPPPYDDAMARASSTVAGYCQPARPHVSRPEFLAALQEIAERAQRDPDSEFSVDDSEEPGTARDLLAQLRGYRTEGRACAFIAADVARASRRVGDTTPRR
jgi:hypothetical protein